MHHIRKTQTGFTLTEMAIVIVLGGILLAAGLMAGRGQISRAQAQDVVQIVGDLQTASASFKQRYGYLPGDLPTPGTVLSGAVAGTGPGVTNGNGRIEGAVSATGIATATGEIAVAPQQLYLAGLIGKIGTDATQYLQTKFGPVHLRTNVAASTATAYVTAYPSVANVIVLYNLPCEVVSEVEAALDDGGFQTGRARSSVPTCVAGATVPRYWVPL
ncbi:MAG: prepilin-type N-terminal cleavage/methylation domain-containing protein [Rhodoferax sp.]|nr:prepilin-type N-terminal cleavage/methylation domain-containing protein [Rhodoferax sp.]